MTLAMDATSERRRNYMIDAKKIEDSISLLKIKDLNNITDREQPSGINHRRQMRFYDWGDCVLEDDELGSSCLDWDVPVHINLCKKRLEIEGFAEFILTKQECDLFKIVAEERGNTFPLSFFALPTPEEDDES